MDSSKNIAAIYNQYISDLVNYGNYLGFEKEYVKDAIHDVFVNLAHKINLLEEITNIKFYLFRSLKNRLLDLEKSKKDFLELDNSNYSHNIPFVITINIEDLIIEKEEQQQIKSTIEEMLSSLTNRQREIIYLRYIHEYNYDEIAELLEISVHGCRKLLSKAIITLREKYSPLILFYLTYFIDALK